jgi:hypothetical protein
LAASRLLSGDIPDQFGQIDVECGGEGMDHYYSRIANATFQMIDHRTANAGEPRQLALRNPAPLAGFFERTNEGTGKLL